MRFTRPLVLASLALCASHVPAQPMLWRDEALLAGIYLEGAWQDYYAGDRTPLYELQQAIDTSVATSAASGQPLRFFYKTSSDETRVVRTQRRVSGAYPSCGAGTPKLGEDVQRYLLALETLAAGVDKALGTLFLAKFVASLVAFAVGEANLYQTEANCSNVCTLVPAQVPEKELLVETYFRVEAGPWAKRTAPSDFGHWSHLEAPVISHSTAKLAIKPGDPLRHKAADEKTCEMRMVCTRLRNWSAHREVSAKIEVSFDANPAYGKMCVDYTMLSDSVRNAVVSAAMDRDRAKNYFDAWRGGFKF